jgi:hypothetical protein
MSDIKNAIGILAVILVFVGYIPYFRDILKGKTIPHIYSWALWGFVTLIVFALQLSAGAGVASYVTLAVALMCTTVAVMALRQKAKWDITVSDKIFFTLALLSVVIWLVAKQPVISAILTALIDVFGFMPTIRKSWNKPHTETLSMYALNSFRFVLAIIAIQQYSIITLAYPVTWCIMNALFAIMLGIRRKQLNIAS